MINVKIIGGGISGVMSAIQLSKNKNFDITIYEERNTLLKSLPYCHLHAGGFLYPEMSLNDCQNLLIDCLDFAEYFPDAILKRPTIIAYNKKSKFTTNSLIFKCKLMKLQYRIWSNKNKNFPLGEVDKYYSIYNKGETNGNIYVENFFKLLKDKDSIKYPIICVNEFGINQKIVEKQLMKELNNTNVKVLLNTRFNFNFYEIPDLLINATGYQIGKGVLELKTSFLTIKSTLPKLKLPEIAIIGERNTENSLIQLTPTSEYAIFQVHYMNNNSSIIKQFTDIKDIYMNDNEYNKRGNIAINKINEYLDINLEYLDYCSGIQLNNKNIHSRISNITKHQNYIEINLVKAVSVIRLIKNL